jgi:hypothetical protein
LNWGIICPPIIFYGKNVLEVACKKEKLSLTAEVEIFTPMRRLGIGKFNNQQRLGLGGKGNNGGRLVVVVDGTTAAAVAA